MVKKKKKKRSSSKSNMTGILGEHGPWDTWAAVAAAGKLDGVSLVVVVHGPSWLAACGIFLDR